MVWKFYGPFLEIEWILILYVEDIAIQYIFPVGVTTNLFIMYTFYSCVSSIKDAVNFMTLSWLLLQQKTSTLTTERVQISKVLTSDAIV